MNRDTLLQSLFHKYGEIPILTDIKSGHRIALKFVTCIGLLLAVNTLTAAAEEPKQQENGNFLFTPILFYSPETRLAFGAAASYIFRFADALPEDPPSSISPLILYTLEEQFNVLLSTTLYLKNGSYRVDGEARVRSYPDRFFGIGNQTIHRKSELFTSHSTKLSLSLLRRIRNNFRLGLKYDFSKWDIRETKFEGILEGGTISGSNGGWYSGLSLLLNLDSRDHIFSPARGEMIDLSLGLYNRLIGSQFNFGNHFLDARKYIPILSSHVLAFHSRLHWQTGNVPFLKLAKLGGNSNLRGYYEGRFRDTHLFLFQAEYRMPLIWRLGLVGFTGWGDVARQWSSFTLDNLKHSFGFGLRYLFSKSEKIYLRFDFAWAEEVFGFYVSVFEAF